MSSGAGLMFCPVEAGAAGTIAGVFHITLRVLVYKDELIPLISLSILIFFY